MKSFEDRQQGFEAKFAHDADTEFRVVARRNKLAGLWAAQQLDHPDPEAYAKTVVQADFEEAGDEDVVRKLAADLGDKASTDTIRAKLRELLPVAKAQLMTEI